MSWAEIEDDKQLVDAIGNYERMPCKVELHDPVFNIYCLRY